MGLYRAYLFLSQNGPITETLAFIFAFTYLHTSKGFSVAELSQLLFKISEILVAGSLLSLLEQVDLSLVESETSILSFLFNGIDDGALLPSNKGAQITQNAVGSELFQSEDFKSSGDDLSLLLVEGSGHTFEAFQSGYRGKRRGRELIKRNYGDFFSEKGA